MHRLRLYSVPSQRLFNSSSCIPTNLLTKLSPNTSIQHSPPTSDTPPSQPRSPPPLLRISHRQIAYFPVRIRRRDTTGSRYDLPIVPNSPLLSPDIFLPYSAKHPKAPPTTGPSLTAREWALRQNPYGAFSLPSSIAYLGDINSTNFHRRSTNPGHPRPHRRRPSPPPSLRAAHSLCYET